MVRGDVSPITTFRLEVSFENNWENMQALSQALPSYDSEPATDEPPAKRAASLLPSFKVQAGLSRKQPEPSEAAYAASQTHPTCRTASCPTAAEAPAATIRSKKDESRQMKAVHWFGKEDVRVLDTAVPLVTDPQVGILPGAAAAAERRASSLGSFLHTRMPAQNQERRDHTFTLPAPSILLASRQDVVLRVTSTCICGSDLHLVGPATSKAASGRACSSRD